MKKIFLLLLSCTLFLGAKEISGITIEDSYVRENVSYSLQGAGVRDKFFMDMYVLALYTTQSYSEAKTIVQADTPMSMRLHITSSLISSEKMEAATREGFLNATKGKAGALQSQIETFIAVFKEPIVPNDLYELVYTPDKGVMIYKNKILKNTIEGLDFKQALFSIWLGEKPAQESLKKALLGD